MKSFLSILCILFILSSCSDLRSFLNPVGLHSSDMLEPTLHKITKNLMWQVIKNEGFKAFFKKEKRLIVIDPFVNGDSGEVLKASADIEQIIIDAGMTHFKRFDFIRMSYENLLRADYALNGIIERVSAEEPYYQISASVVNLKTATIVARTDMNLYDNTLDYTATSFYEDSPMYIKDEPLDGGVQTATLPVGEPANEAYYDSLKTIAILVEAETAYEKKEYETALNLLKIAAKRPDGQLMKTYAGLYTTYAKLGYMDKAEESFAKLLAISVERNRMLSVKFLFDVDTIGFWKDPLLTQHYALWLRQIGKYFSNSPYCLHIIGHCSRSGTERHNSRLSLERAQKVRELLQTYFPLVEKRSIAIGRGFRENIIGSGTDDVQDMIDRRVEFKVVECEK